MLNWNLLVAFTSILGDVHSADVEKSLELMGKGMLDIFIVMLLIFLVIVILNKTTHDKNDDK